jgi:hypothetical protein
MCVLQDSTAHTAFGNGAPNEHRIRRYTFCTSTTPETAFTASAI